MTYVRHVTLTTGHVRDSERSEIADDALVVCADLLDAALIASPGMVPIPAVEPPCRLRVSAEGRVMLATVHGPDTSIDGRDLAAPPIVTFGVALHSRGAAMLWRLLHDDTSTVLATDRERVPSAPWIATRVEVGAMLYPDALHWLGDFERCLAWAALARRTQ